MMLMMIIISIAAAGAVATATATATTKAVIINHSIPIKVVVDMVVMTVVVFDINMVEH